MFEVGDIVRIYAPMAGHTKYHLCISVGSNGGTSQFLFLNSNPEYESSFPVPCARVPCIQPSDTGVTVFSFSILPRYTYDQLRFYNAAKLGRLTKELAIELLEFAATVQTFTRPEKKMVLDALQQIALM